MIRQLLIGGLLLSWTFGVTGRAAADDDVQVYRLAITPAAKPQPALKYRLFPAARELTDGNAAGLYYRALLQFTAFQGRFELRTKVDEYHAMELDQLPRDEARKALGAYYSAFGEARLATFRKHANWDIPLREGGIHTLLTEVQEVRSLARAMSLRARLEMLDGDYGAAIQSIEDMLVMARHVGGSGTLVSSLVGLAIVGAAGEEILRLAEQPGSPNLYWALTALPDPLVDMKTGFESEQLWLGASIPYLDVIETSVLSSQQAAELAEKLGAMVAEVTDSPAAAWPQEAGLTPTAAALAPALGSYAQCKRTLIARGLDPALVEAMPVVQVTVLSWLLNYRDQLDEMTAFTNRPHAEVHEQLSRLQNVSQDAAQRPEGFLTNLLLPAVGAAENAFTRQTQRVALLRVIEALRLYAAGHDGKLPTALAEISDVPLPADPATGRPFDYSLDGATAVLRPARLISEFRYEITVKQ